MKRFRFCYILSLFLICINFTACVNFIPELSEDEEKLVVRYMADAVVTHDASYESSLYDYTEKVEALKEEERKALELDKIVEEENKKKEEHKNNNKADDVEISFVEKIYTINDLADFLSIDGVTFEYVSSNIVDKYPDSDAAGMLVYKPELGNLLVVKLNVCNISGNDLTVDLTNKNTKIKAIINDDTKVSCINQTFFLEAFNNFKEDIAKEQVKETVLLFEVEEDCTIDTLDLIFNGSGKEQMKIRLK